MKDVEASDGEAMTAFNERIKLYLMHFCFAFVSRMWDMGIVLLVAVITNNSLQLVALNGFASSFSVFMLMSTVGAWLDGTNRMVAVRIALSVKIVAVSLAYSVCAYLTVLDKSGDPTFHYFCLYSLPVLTAIVSLSFSTITQSIEKDWIVVLSGGDSSWLSTTNSTMSLIDLGCSSLAPALTGFLFTIQSASGVAITLLASNFASTVLLYFYMLSLYNSWPSLAVRSSKKAVETNSSTERKIELKGRKEYQAIPSEESGAKRNSHQDSSSPRGLFGGFFDDFSSSGCAGCMVAYSLLYLTVLSFGSLMTVYVKWAGVTEEKIGIFRGIAALTGFTGAAVFPYAVSAMGLWTTGKISVLYQFVLVAFAASSFFWTTVQVSVYVIMIAVVRIFPIALRNCF